MYMNDGNKTKINLKNKSVFITGVAGFIGSNLAKRLLSTVEGVKVVGLDNMNHYYDVRLKEARLNELEQLENFSFVKGNLADKSVIEAIFEQYKPEIVVNLGAQAGVRYSITNPDAYVEANLIGFYNILEACRHSYDEGHTPVEHLVYVSSSSVYGSNKKVPYSTDDKVDNPVSLYAATKKSNELMAHAYSKLYNIPSTGLRFFTVYGPAGRPDMDYDTFANTRLRDVPYEVFEAYKDRLPELWRRRAEHYYGEFARAEKGAELWRKGDLEGYGQLVFESGKSSIYSYECGCDELKKLYEIMVDTDGIYGGRFSGAGFKGCCMALIDPDKAEDIEVKVTAEYLKAFPELDGKYSFHLCESADGVEL